MMHGLHHISVGYSIFTILLCHNFYSILLYLKLKLFSLFVVIVHLLSRVWLFVTPWTAECQASLSFSISWSLLKFMSVESLMPSNYLIFCRSLFLPSVFPSSRVFSRVGSSRWVATVLELQLQHQSFQWIFQGWFLLGLTGLVSSLSTGFSGVFSSTTVWKH